MSNNTTQRSSSTTILIALRQVNAALNALALKKANRTHSLADALERKRLQAKKEHFERELADAALYEKQVKS
jgi:hypothetical protein